MPHKRLLSKLSHCGINGQLLRWITEFLVGRQEQVLLGSGSRLCCDVLSEVPQGSVLGPLLFLIYINDLPTGISSTVRLYVDDVIIYRAIHSNNDILMQQED